MQMKTIAHHQLTNAQPVTEQQPLTAFPLILLLSTTPYSMGYPFGLLGSAVLAASPPSFLCTPSPVAGGMVRGAEKALALCKCCSAITKISLSYQYCFQHKSKTWTHTNYYEEN